MTKRVLPGLGGTPISSTQAFSLSSLNLPGKPPEDLYAGGRIAHAIKEGDRVPVGMIYKPDGNVQVVSECLCDFSKCTPLFEPMNQLASELNSKSLFGHLAMGIDAQTVTDMWAFYGIGMMNSRDSGLPLKVRTRKREKAYTKSRLVPLSKMAREGLAVCAELTALAKFWLDGRGYKTTIVNHAFRFADDPQSVSMHAMVAVEQARGILLFDPTNMTTVLADLFPDFLPSPDGRTAAPGLYIISRNEWERVRMAGKDKPALITLDNASAWARPEKREKAYFGFATLAQMQEPEKWLIPPAAAPAKGPEKPSA